MTVFQKAVTGFNNNIPRKGRSYHVQTEDSGINHPHIMTHLFLGGNIIASKKTSYADILDAPDLAERVRAMMDEQHKEMMRNLLAGKYDSQAAQSVQLHAPKVETIANTPASRASASAPRQEPATKPASAAKPAPASSPAPEAKPVEAPVSDARLSAPDKAPPTAHQETAPGVEKPHPPSLSQAALDPNIPAEEHLRAALSDYLSHARGVAGRP